MRTGSTTRSSTTTAPSKISRRRLPTPSKPAVPISEPDGWYVGIDQSLTAFAAVAVAGTEDKDPKRYLYKPASKGVRRLRAIQDGLTDWLKELEWDMPIRHVAMEGYANGAKFGREAMGECGAAVKLALLDWYSPEKELSYPTIIEPMQVKSFAGCGNSKQEMLLTVYKKWGVEFRDDNLADAFVIAMVAASLELGARFEYQKAVLAKVKVHAEWEQQKSSPRTARKTSSG
jgi:crossover junction endodeoxyribonuclease RuvC